MWFLRHKKAQKGILKTQNTSDILHPEITKISEFPSSPRCSNCHTSLATYRREDLQKINRSDDLTVKLGQIGNIKPPRFASQKSCLKRIWRSPAVPLFHTSFLRKKHRCLWISTLLNKHLESSRYSVIVLCLSETAANTWEWSLHSDLALSSFPFREFQIMKFRWFHDCRSQSWKSEEEMKTLPEGSNCGRTTSMTCHQRFDRHKVSQVAWQKAEFLEFLEFHKIWVLHQNEDDYTAGCHVLNKVMLQQGSVFTAFRVCVCVISICLPALVFVLQKFGLKTPSCILP